MARDTIIKKYSNSLKNLLKFLPKLSLINPDLIYSNTLVFPWGAIAANKLNKPHIWHIHEYGDLDHSLKFDSYYSEIIQFIDQYSDQIIVNSKSVSKHIKEFLIYNKNPILSYYFIKIDPKLLVKLNKSPYQQKDSLKILVAATIHPGKNQLEAIKAIKNLIAGGIEAELLLLGSVADTNYLDKINAYIDKHNLVESIHVKNFVNNPYPYFLESDVVLVTSHKEAYGRTAVEGMLLKKPVIVTKEGGSNEIIRSGKTGYSYHVGDINKLIEILNKLANKSHREKIGKTGYQSLKKINNKNEYGNKIAKIIKDTIKNYQPSNQLTNIFINVFSNEYMKLDRAKKELHQTKEELKVKTQNNCKAIHKLEKDLNKIKSTRCYIIWQKYNFFKNQLFKIFK